MKLKKTIIIFSIFAIVFIGPLSLKAQAASTTSNTDYAAMLLQIQELLKLIALLQEQLNAQTQLESGSSVDELVSSVDSVVYNHDVNSDPSSHNESFTVKNISTRNIKYSISVENQPPWLNTGYATGELTSYAGHSFGLGAYFEPGDLGAGTYETEIKITGNFKGSPLSIPVILNVVDEDAEDGEVQISDPDRGAKWKIGSGQIFKWSTDGMSSRETGRIDLVSDAMYIKSRIANIRNSGGYLWNVGEVYSGYKIEPGEYFASVVIGGVGELVGPFTILPADDSEPIDIEARHTIVGESGGYVNYKLDLSGGDSSNPVTKWKLNFSCPEDTEVFAKVDGAVCGGNDYTVGDGVSPANNTSVTFAISSDATEGDLKIRIRAYGLGGEKMDDIDYNISLD